MIARPGRHDLAAEPDLLAARPELAAPALEKLLRELVRIPSVNPGVGERALADHVVDWLHDRTAAEVHVVESLPGRPSVAAVLGRGSGPALVLNGHLDTVPIDDPRRWSVDPFAGTVRDGRMYGRGACDMKAGLAVQLAVARLLSGAAESLRGRLILHFAIGEECAEPGTSSLLAAGFGGDLAVVGEPTGLAIAVAARGLVHLRVRIGGRSGHAGRPELARNPLAALAEILARVDRYGRSSGASHPLLPPGSCTPTMVQAGVKENAVPDRCTLVLDRRLVPGETVDGEIEELRRRLSDLGASHEVDIDVERITPGFEPVAVDPECDLARRLGGAVASVTGRMPEIVGTPYASDVSRLVSEAGMEAVTFGAGRIEHCHCADEHVDLDEVRDAALAIALLCCDVLL